jgi:hypothetical protein
MPNEGGRVALAIAVALGACVNSFTKLHESAPSLEKKQVKWKFFFDPKKDTHQTNATGGEREGAAECAASAPCVCSLSVPIRAFCERPRGRVGAAARLLRASAICHVTRALRVLFTPCLRG